jgi:hypothetical protein
MLIQNYIIFCSAVWPYRQSLATWKERSASTKENIQNLDFKLLDKNRDHLNTNSASCAGSRKTRQKVMTPFTLYSSSEHQNSYCRYKLLIHQNIKVDHSWFRTRSFFYSGHHDQLDYGKTFDLNKMEYSWLRISDGSDSLVNAQLLILTNYSVGTH